MSLLSPIHIIIILLVALLVFGPKRLPEIGRSLGQGLRELKKASRDITDALSLDDQEPTPTAAKEVKLDHVDSKPGS